MHENLKGEIIQQKSSLPHNPLKMEIILKFLDIGVQTGLEIQVLNQFCNVKCKRSTLCEIQNGLSHDPNLCSDL